MSGDCILIEGAREHNLKSIDVRIPRNRLTVVTGLSGSGKSSLAFDTLYAEGQRRYVESLSAYARQFLNQMQKPDADRIEGLSPAIAIEQRTAGANPRSTVATSTEMHDFLRLLYANIGERRCPRCGKGVERQSAQQIVEFLLELPARTRLTLLAPLVTGKKGRHDEVVDEVRRLGYVRVRIDGTVHDVDEAPALDPRKTHTIEAVVDRLIVTLRIRTRLADSVETALEQGEGNLIVVRDVTGAEPEETVYSELNACTDCGISYGELSPRHFSFNSPYGACPTCSGLGTRLVFDEALVVKDPDLSIADGAIGAWRRGAKSLIVHYRSLLRGLAKHYKFSLDTQFRDLPADVRKILLYGSGEEKIEYGSWRRKTYRRQSKPFEGVMPNLDRRYLTTKSNYSRQRLRDFMTRQLCPDCRGARLKPEAAACLVGGKSIVDVTGMPVDACLEFFQGLALSSHQEKIAGQVLREIRRRLECLAEIGLAYLTLDRQSGSLSGGEAQRIRLATQIGAGLAGVLYVLDEPTIGLHVRDTGNMLGILRNLRDMGNTVVVVEHDEQMIRSADHVIDLGPGAGRLGGEVVAEGTVDDLLANPLSLTARYLNREGTEREATPRKAPGKERLKIVGAAENNLDNIDVTIPLGLFVCVTGVSGSGKSTLVDVILRRALFRHFYRSKDVPGKHSKILGLTKLDKAIVIDQAPIGRTPRSNPATYTGVFSHVRKLFSATPTSRVRGYGPGRYSFNVKGGRCETCKGDGIIRLEMHFLPDVYVTCEQCGGLRYNRETLEVRYGGRNIAEVLAMTIDEALDFFENVPPIEKRLRTLSDVGLGYLQLGQSATTLSGGEAQRTKLSAELGKTATGSTIYLLDEPTTGLHFADIQRLLTVLHRLRDAGNTIVVIEHNLEVIRAADHIIDLGPEGGDGGGDVVVCGTPEKVAACVQSHTGHALADAMR